MGEVRKKAVSIQFSKMHDSNRRNSTSFNEGENLSFAECMKPDPFKAVH